MFKPEYTVVWAGGPQEGQDFSSFGDARRFAEGQQIATMICWDNDDFRRATWYKGDRTWYDGPDGAPLKLNLYNHLKPSYRIAQVNHD